MINLGKLGQILKKDLDEFELKTSTAYRHID